MRRDSNIFSISTRCVHAQVIASHQDLLAWLKFGVGALCHDTGCITTLDKNQWIGKAAGKDYSLPVLADVQFAALACGAHPYKIVQSHWHASATESLMEKMGIDWEAAKAEFESYPKEVEAGNFETLYDPRLAITSGPGFQPVRQLAGDDG